MTEREFGVPLYDPRAEYLALQEPIDRAIRDVLDSGVYTAGAQVAEFEAELARYCRVPQTIGVASGTAALELALMAAGVGPGDEVVTAPNSDISTAAAITHCGARVVFSDIEPDTLVMNPNEIASKLTPKSKAILPVHLFGQLCDMDSIASVASDYELVVIEDAALAIGGEYRRRMAGTIGDVGCYSMNSRKILSAFGDAGAVITSRDDIAQTVRSLRDYGKNPSLERLATPGENEFLHEGFNARLDEIQAAVLRVKLTKLPEALERRRSIAARYNEGLSRLPLSLPVEQPESRHAFRAYTVLVESREVRDLFANHLTDRRIASATYYTPPLHLQPAYRYLGHGPGDFPVAERIASTMLCLPIHPTLSDEQVDAVIGSVVEFFTAAVR